MSIIPLVIAPHSSIALVWIITSIITTTIMLPSRADIPLRLPPDQYNIIPLDYIPTPFIYSRRLYAHFNHCYFILSSNDSTTVICSNASSSRTFNSVSMLFMFFFNVGDPYSESFSVLFHCMGTLFFYLYYAARVYLPSFSPSATLEWINDVKFTLRCVSWM